MSKPFKRNHPLHLCRSGNSFQYNRIFPEGFPSAPGIPKQIRWSLGLDSGIAARCAELLNRSFDLLVNQALEQRWRVLPRFHGKRPCLLRVYLALIGVQLLTAIAVGFRIGLVVSTCALIAVELVGVVIILLLLSLVVA